MKEIEAAALRAAHDGAMQIENALAAAADKVSLFMFHRLDFTCDRAYKRL